MPFSPFVLLLTLLLLNTATAMAAKPNILVILADDLGYSDLGCYGGEIATPNLDALALNGLRYTQFYNTARCWPSRAALMTGYYAQQVRRDVIPGLSGAGKGARPGWAPLLTQFLNDAGYQSYHSGKWHIDGHPLQNGFQHSYEIGGKAESNYFKSESTLEDGKPVEQTSGYYATAAIADHAVRVMREHGLAHSGVPFFHYLAFTSPHFPLHAPDADIEKYRGKYLKGWNVNAAERHARMTQMGLVHHALPQMEATVGPPYEFPNQVAMLGPNEVNRPVPWETLSQAQRAFQAEKMAIHAAMVERMDREIGRVLQQLKDMGVFENTLILFASDNGASAEMMVRGDGHDPAASMGSARSFLCLGPGWSSSSNTPLRLHKTWVHEGGISTPLIVHWPAGIRAQGELRHHPGHLVDVLPTLLEVSGAQKPAEIQGQPVPPAPGTSLVASFAKDNPELKGQLWWQHNNHRAIRSGDWKLVALGGGEWELYDLLKDRGESNNLAMKHPERVRELAALWEAQAQENRRLALSDVEQNPSGASRKLK